MENGRWRGCVESDFGDPYNRSIRRARTEIELVVDGDIVDLNRIKLPADTPIIDKRAPQPQPPALDGTSAAGLQIVCEPVKARYGIGEPVHIPCTITNTTDRVKPIAWHGSTGNHFCLVQSGTQTRSGLLPRAFPLFRAALRIVGNARGQGYILYLGAGKSITFMLTHQAERPSAFKGRVVYDPLAPRDGWVATGEDVSPPWRSEWASSNEFEYDVVVDGE